ncbi:MAG: TcpQ domain-containing protein [Bdellovibrionales bacterium]
MHKKHLFSSAVSLTSAAVALFLSLEPSPAYAGFQWISPAQESVSVAPVPEAQAKPVTSLDVLPPPQIIEGKAAPALTPLPSTPAAPAIPTPLPAPATNIVQGFADRVPLSVALRQILPEEVGFSVAQNVDMGTFVSWKGGAPWQEVLADALSPLDLAFKEQGSLVQIVRADPKKDGAPFVPSVSASEPDKMTALPPLPSLAPSPKQILPVAEVAPQGKPVALLPSANEMPLKTVPDRNMPNGFGGYLPTAPVAPAPGSLPPVAKMAPAPIVQPSVTPPEAPYIPVGSIGDWQADKGETLQAVLGAWCKRANIELSWQAEYDYPLQASVTLSGSFEDAVRTLLAGFQEASPQPVGYLYNNQHAGQTVLVVQVRGNNYNQ